MPQEEKEIYENSKKELGKYAQSWHIGSLSFYGNSKIDDKEVLSTLQRLGFGGFRLYCEVVDDNSGNRVDAITYYSTCPKCMSYENFSNALIDVGRVFEADSVMVYDSEYFLMKIFSDDDPDFREFFPDFTDSISFLDFDEVLLLEIEASEIFGSSEVDLRIDDVLYCSALRVTNPGPTAMTLSRKIRNYLSQKYKDCFNHIN